MKSDSGMEGGLCGLVERSSPLTSCVWCQNSGGTVTVTETIHRLRGSICGHIYLGAWRGDTVGLLP